MSSAKTSPAAAASGRLETMMSHFMKGPLGSVQTIAVFGAGLMGSGIAQVAAQAGFKVLLIDVNDKAIKWVQTVVAWGVVADGTQQRTGHYQKVARACRQADCA